MIMNLSQHVIPDMSVNTFAITLVKGTSHIADGFIIPGM